MSTFTQSILRWLISLFILSVIQSSTGCPSACTCKWKGGKEWVECASRGLQGLPQGAREETQVLDLSGNQLISLAADSFFVLRLINLQRLYLSHTRIRRIATRAFTGLQGLVELDLSENELRNIPSETFSSVGNLMRLNLANNPLRTISRDTFRHLGQLSFLDLSRCHLVQVDSGAFAGLHALEWLKLNDNLLENVPEATLPLTIGLHGLPVHGNPWLCDCHLLTLYDWLRISQSQMPQETEPTCAGPARLYSRPVRMLKRQELACAPRISLTKSLDVYEGENVTFECIIQAIPEPITIWLLNGLPISLEHDSTKDGRIRYNNKFTSDDKMISILEIFGSQLFDEGIYICQAENAAGLIWSNLTLRVSHQEYSTSEPPTENADAGYAAVIAAGALLGTLFALGCLFLGIYLYARHLRSYSKNNLEKLSPKDSLITPSILKKNSGDSLNTVRKITKDNTHSQAKESKSTIELTSTANIFTEDVAKFVKSETYSERMQLQDQYVTHRCFIEPDLINEVPNENGYIPINYQKHYQPYFESYSSYMDHDGYPLNFGLPKLGTIATRVYNATTCEPLSRVCQWQQFSLSHPTALSGVHFSHENKFLTNNIHTYPAHTVFKMNFDPMTPASFLPTPAATLSPHSFLQIGKLGNSKIFQISSCKNGSKNISKSQEKSLENQEALEHPESPDEGYVGDALDV